jgi:hypothetical protein
MYLQAKQWTEHRDSLVFGSRPSLQLASSVAIRKRGLARRETSSLVSYTNYSVRWCCVRLLGGAAFCRFFRCTTHRLYLRQCSWFVRFVAASLEQVDDLSSPNGRFRAAVFVARDFSPLWTCGRFSCMLSFLRLSHFLCSLFRLTRSVYAFLAGTVLCTLF